MVIKSPKISKNFHLNESQKDGGWTWLLLMTGLGTTFGTAVPSGYAVGVTNSIHLFIKEWSSQKLLENYNWTLTQDSIEVLWALIVSIFLIGGIIGSAIGAPIADRFGRKGGLLICCILLTLGNICCFYCRLVGFVELILFGRILIGTAGGLTTAVLPMYLSEIAPLQLRGTLSVFCGMGLAGGVVFGQIFSLKEILGTEMYWHYALACNMIFIILCLSMHVWYPESPKWLIAVKKDMEKGTVELRRLRGNATSNEQIQAELSDIQNECGKSVKKCSVKSVFSDPKLFLPIFLVCVFQIGLQFSGINAIFFYSVTIFLRAGLTSDEAQWASLGAGFVNLFVSALGPLLMAKFNRRPLMLSSALGCSICLLIFTLLLYYIDSVTAFANISIACIFVYIMFFQLGLGPIPLFIGSELFTVDPRPVAMSFGSLISWSCNFLIGMTFPSLQIFWGAFVFLPFSIACLFVYLITLFYLPETKGRDVSEVVKKMEKGFKSDVFK